MNALLARKWFKAFIFVLCLLPLLLLLWRFYRQDLGANPLEFITHATGDWALRFLVIGLAVTPVRRLTGLSNLIRIRKLIGLYAFFYATLHFITYLWFDKFFDLADMWKDIYKRPYITIGFLAFILLIPLALTSTTSAIRRLGGKRWQALHRLVYVCAVAAVIHYWWLVKSDIRWPLFYGILTVTLLGYRLVLQRDRVARASKPTLPII